ncbi:PIPO, partial [Potato virus V]|uniref:PIPO n=1 Tax=Potato virus V TaxID=40640 RepID=UPI000265130B
KLHGTSASAVARIKLAGKVIFNLAVKEIKKKASDRHNGRKSARFERSFHFLSESIIYRGISPYKNMGR